MMADTVLFDLDNTLTDRAASIRAFSQRFLVDFQYQLSKHISFDELHEVISTGDGGGYRPKDEMFREIQIDLPWIDAPTLEAIATYWYTVSAQCMQLRKDGLSTLEELLRRGYILGVVTNGKTRVQNATIDAVGIRAYFSTVVISEECGFRKPAPEIFGVALSNLNKRADYAVHVGDNPDADIQGAFGAGLGTIWFRDADNWPADLHAPDHQIDQMSQILEILK